MKSLYAMTKEDKIKFCNKNLDAVFPMIKILVAPIYEMQTVDQVRLFSIVVVHECYVPVYDIWEGKLSLENCLKLFRNRCKMISENYKVSESDILISEVRGQI